jgi:hypothetical protein
MIVAFFPDKLLPVKILRTIYLLSLCVLAAGRALADASWAYESSTTTGPLGLGPYYGTSTDSLVAGGNSPGSSTMLVNPTNGASSVSAIIDFGGPSGNENFLHVNSSSKDIQNCVLEFDLVTSSAVLVNNLSYNAFVYHVNQGPESITWSYSIDGGAIQDFQQPAIDLFSNQGSWQTYNPIFGLFTSGPSTIHIYGTIAAVVQTTGNNNGEIGLDNFTFNVTPVPEPAPMVLLLAGLGLLAWRRASA